MFRHAWRIGRIGGVDIKVDASWAVIAALIGYSLYLQFTISYEVLTPATGAILAAAATALFFGSVLAHEMTHALAARRLGIQVRDITLFIFGGATEANVDSRGPGAEFLVSALGPLSSALLGGAFLAMSVGLRPILPLPVLGALGYLGWVNLILAGFNLVPGFPLDGGRMFRAAVWRITGSLRRATALAAGAGQAIGYLLAVAGLFLIFRGALIGGVWFAAIGWFLAQTARMSSRAEEIRRQLASADVDDVMDEDLVTIPWNLTLREAVEQYLARVHQEVVPVVVGRRAVGALTPDAVRTVPRDAWDRQTVADHMIPLASVPVVPEHARMEELLALLEGSSTGFLFVMRGAEVIGVVSPEDLSGWLKRHSLAA